MNIDRFWAKIKIRIEKIKEIPILIVKHIGFVFVLILLASFFIGSILFYEYGYSVINRDIKAGNEITSFDRELYQKMINRWEGNEEKINDIEGKSYPNPFTGSKASEKPATSSEEESQLTDEEKEELLSNPDVQGLLKADNLFEFYTTKEEEFLTIEERAKIWGQLNLGSENEYEGGYYQNIKLLRELKKELTK